jgi:hypothetical protein
MVIFGDIPSAGDKSAKMKSLSIVTRDPIDNAPGLFA